VPLPGGFAGGRAGCLGSRPAGLDGSPAADGRRLGEIRRCSCLKGLSRRPSEPEQGGRWRSRNKRYRGDHDSTQPHGNSSRKIFEHGSTSAHPDRWWASSRDSTLEDAGSKAPAERIEAVRRRRPRELALIGLCCWAAGTNSLQHTGMRVYLEPAEDDLSWPPPGRTRSLCGPGTASDNHK